MSGVPERFLSEAELRQVLRECVTVVKPGETLAFTPADPNWTPNQLRNFQEEANAVVTEMGLGIHLLVLPPGSLGVLEDGS